VKIETRDFAVRLAPDDAGLVSGYAALWNKPDAFGDVLVRGAFAASLALHAKQDTRPLMLWSHDPASPIGVWDELREDARGLKVTGRLVLEATGGRDAYALMKAGAVDGLSIGFRTVKAAPLPNAGRRVEAVDLIEISIVARPAQSAARVTNVKSAAVAAPDAAGLAAFIRRAAAKIGGKE
jgi:HK97 family phage prohead protease